MYERNFGYLILAGGENRRMGGSSKLFMEIGGVRQLERLRALAGAAECQLSEDIIEEGGTESFPHQNSALKPGNQLCTEQRWVEDENAMEVYRQPSLWLSVRGAQGPQYAQYQSAGLPLIADEKPGLGPLGGIASGLRQSGAEALLVLPCDQFGLQPVHLTALVKQYQKSGKAVFWHQMAYEDGGAPGSCEALTFQEERKETKKRRGIVPFPGLYTAALLPLIDRALPQGKGSLRRLIAEAVEVKGAELLSLPPELDTFYNVNTPQAREQMEDFVRTAKSPVPFGYERHGGTVTFT